MVQGIPKENFNLISSLREHNEREGQDTFKGIQLLWIISQERDVYSIVCSVREFYKNNDLAIIVG